MSELSDSTDAPPQPRAPDVGCSWFGGPASACRCRGWACPLVADLGVPGEGTAERLGRAHCPYLLNPVRGEVSKYGQKGEDRRSSRFRPFLFICGMSKYGAGNGCGRKALIHIWLWRGFAGAAARVARSPAAAASGSPNPDRLDVDGGRERADGRGPSARLMGTGAQRRLRRRRVAAPSRPPARSSSVPGSGTKVNVPS